MTEINDLKQVDLNNIPAKDLAFMLKKALGTTPFNIRELVAKTDLNYNTVKGYFGGSKKPTRETFDKLIKALGLETEIQEKQGEYHKKELVTHPKQHKNQSAAKEKAVYLSYLMKISRDYLEFFRNSSATERDVLRNTIPPEEVGYFTSLLSSLFNEEHFKMWKTFQK